MYGVQPTAAVTPSTSGQYTTQTRTAIPSAGPRPRVAGPQRKRKKKKKKGGVPGINKYLAGDTTYQDQRSQLMKQLEQFRTSNRSQRGMVGQDFDTALQKMLRQKDTDMSNMKGDYGSRGLLNSGLFTKSVGDYDTDYQQQTSELNVSKQRSLSDLLESLQNYMTENKSSILAAKQDAIRRRAQKYGITA